MICTCFALSGNAVFIVQFSVGCYIDGVFGFECKEITTQRVSCFTGSEYEIVKYEEFVLEALIGKQIK